MAASINQIKVTPLGGLGQIGSNMTLFEGSEESIILDSGLLFPRETSTGVQYLIPNFYSINKYKIQGLFITHCHEDHIGALGHLLDFIPNLKIYTEIFTAKVIQKKFRKHTLNIVVINEYFDITFKNFNVHSFRVNHSTANTLGFIVKNKEDSLIFSSDFKIDIQSLNENLFDFNRVKMITDKTRKISFLDSTNILRKNKTPNESEIIPNLSRLIQRKKRIIITFFPSNIFRFLNLIRLCHQKNKTPVLYGKAMHFYYQCAHESNLINSKDYSVTDIENINPNQENAVFFVSGCQGNFKSTLHNIVMGHSPHLKLSPNDLFIYSASIIPGNDKQVFKIFNLLTEQNVEIVSSTEFPIHCSGHPGQKDLELYIENIKPEIIIPIHGESFFLKKHQEFICEKFPNISTHLLFNHNSLLVDHQLSVVKNKDQNPLLVTYKNKIIDNSFISERRKIGENGIFMIALHSKNIKSNSLGLDISEELNEKILSLSIDYIKKNKNLENLRIKIRKILNEELGHKPHVEIIDVR